MSTVSLASPCATEPFSAPSRLGQHRTLLTGLLLMLLAWGLYLPSVWFGFVHFDDVRILRDHPELYGQPNVSQSLRAIFVTGFPREEPLPLRDVSWVIDSRLFGFGNPFGYHLVNVLLHGLVVALLFALLVKTTRRYTFSLLVTLAWLVLAVHTEPVAWIMGRKDILCSLFMLLALYAQTQRLAAEGKATWCLWYIGTIFLVLGGLLSKVSVLTFPIVLLAHAILLPYLRGDREPDATLPPPLTLIREFFLSVPNLLASAAIYLWYSRDLTQMGIFDRGYTARGFAHFWNLLMIDPLVLLVYLKQIFFPSSLSVLYTWPALQTAYGLGQVIGATCTAALAAVAGIWLFRNRKDLFYYYLSFFVLMVPYLNIAYIGIWVADRYIYLAALFPLIIVLSLADQALRRPGRILRVATFMIAAVVVVDNLVEKLTYERAWRDGETLWQYHVGLSRPSPEAFSNLAAYYYAVAASHQNTPEADLAIQKMMVVIDAGLAQVWPNRLMQPSPEAWKFFFLQSLVQEVNGNPKDALASLLVSDQLRPACDAVNLNLARLYARLARMQTNSLDQKTYAQTARDRFLKYIKLAFRGRTPPREISQELADINMECTQLAR